LDNSLAVPLVTVTFNDGRTAYTFDQRDVVLEYRKKSMYGMHHIALIFLLSRTGSLLVIIEIWWVLRSLTNRVVQKRKGFNVTEPQCTFDLTNNR
jgi:hypothetical protein